MKTLLEIISIIHRGIDRCVSAGQWIALVFVFLLGPIAFYEVVVRKLGHPTTWSFHILVYIQLFMIWFGIAYTQKVRGHVSVDIITRLLPLTTRVVTRIFAHIVCEVITIVLIWESCVMVKRSYGYHLMTTEEFLHPVYWLQIPVVIGAVLLFFVFFSQMCDDIKWLVTGKGSPEDL
ncbi:MAG: TRAP transporter small permease [Syntrophobacterales bacterium]|nr:TRAP transporter small permease [Syntrophobacterales bacterium]